MPAAPRRVIDHCLRAAVLVPLCAWGLQLAGRFYSVDVAMLEHAVLEQVLVLGWMLDESLTDPRAIGGLLVAAATSTVALGAIRPDAGFVRWTQPLAAAALAVPLGAFFVLGYALAPASAVVLLVAAASIRAPHAPSVWPLRALIPGAGIALLFAADLLATSREGTWYDHLTNLPGGAVFAVGLLGAALGGVLLRARPALLGVAALVGLLHGVSDPVAGFAWAGIAAGCLGVVDGLRSLGLPALPDPPHPKTWAPGLIVPTCIAAACLLGNGAVDVQRCPDTDHPAVSLVTDASTPFDLASNGTSLAVVHREEGWMRLFEGGELVHEFTPQEGDLEEVFALPGDRGFLLTEILDDDPFTLLRVVDPSTRTAVTFRLPGMCWISSMAWDIEEDAVLLGCETQADLLRFHLDGRLEAVGRLPADDDLEDLHLRTDARTAYAVSLAEGDQLWALSPDDGAVQAQRDLGGLNYSVVHDPGSDRILVARFHDAQILAFDRDLRPVGRTFAGFGVRPMVGLPAHGLVLAAAMFDGSLRAIDPEGPSQVAALRLGGRVKALDVDPEESRAWLGSTCGVFEIDLRAWLD